MTTLCEERRPETILEYVCLLGANPKKDPPQYGILARSYDPLVDECCTVLKPDGSLEVYGFKDVNLALRRLNNKDEYSPLKKEAPYTHLMNLLKARKNEGTPLRDVISDMKQTFKDKGKPNLKRGPKPKNTHFSLTNVPKLKPAPPRKRRKKHSNKKKSVVKPKTRRKKAIHMGTDIAGFYYDSEMIEPNVSDDEKIPEEGCGPGKYYRGIIVSERWTDLNDLVYECVFNTPLHHAHWYTEAYAHKAVTNFQEIHVAQGWRCAAPYTSVHQDLKVGDIVSRWFPTRELPDNTEDNDALGGAYVNGIIVEIVTNKKANTYKCSFDAPVSREIWCPEDETALYRKRYRDRQLETLKCEVPYQNATGIPKAKGPRQRDAVKEACAVVGRGTWAGVIKGTQDSDNVVADEVSSGEDNVSGDNRERADVDVAHFMTFLKSAVVDDVDDASDDAPLDTTSDAMNLTPQHAKPTGLYNVEQKALRKWLYPCPICTDPADGAHQCGRCFAHVHVICAPPYPGTSEGYGQPVLCGACTGTPIANVKPHGPTEHRHHYKLSLAKNRERKQKTILPSASSTDPLSPTANALPYYSYMCFGARWSIACTAYFANKRPW
jgi:hypothetical protein